MDSLKKIRVAILCTDGFEQSELKEPRAALDAAGALHSGVSPKDGEDHGWHHCQTGSEGRADVALAGARARDFDAPLLPGGVMNPDSLRMHPKPVEFVKAFFDADKPVAAICHGPWMVIEAGVARGRRIAAWPSLKTDLRNAGAEWGDEGGVVGGELVTSPKPGDMPAFHGAMLQRLAQGRRRTEQAA